MVAKSLPDLAYLVECLKCDQAAGTLVWKTRPPEHFKTARRWKMHNSYFAGRKAGYVAGNGYLYVSIDGTMYKNHRLVWKMARGAEPPETIDHINGNKLDDRMANLRAATDIENHRNVGKRGHNTSGLKGAFYNRRFGYWFSQIGIDHKTIYLGSFATAEEAHAAYVEAARKVHGKFFNPG